MLSCSAREASQHGVHEPRGALRAGGADAAHRLVDGRGVGDPIAADDLIGAEPQRVGDERLELLEIAVEHPREQEVQLRPRQRSVP